VFFKRALNPVDVIAISIWHRGNDLVISGSRVAKKSIRNAGHHLTNVELAHRPLPRISTTCLSVSRTATKGRKKTDYFLAHSDFSLLSRLAVSARIGRQIYGIGPQCMDTEVTTESKPDVEASAPMATESTEPPPRKGPITQAPLSRDDARCGGDDYARSPSSVRLSPAEREIAAASGMSPVDYAKQKLRLAELKKQGHYNEP
jgi:hypothetical protein